MGWGGLPGLKPWLNSEAMELNPSHSGRGNSVLHGCPHELRLGRGEQATARANSGVSPLRHA